MGDLGMRPPQEADEPVREILRRVQSIDHPRDVRLADLQVPGELGLGETAFADDALERCLGAGKPNGHLPKLYRTSWALSRLNVRDNVRPVSTSPFPTQVRELAADRGWSIEQVTLHAWKAIKDGPSPGLTRKVFKGERTLTPHVMEAVAAAFEIPPDTFAEYRLAQARDRFDERSRGLAEALANLSQYEAALAAADAADAGPEAPPEPDHARHLRQAKSASGQTGPAGS